MTLFGDAIDDAQQRIDNETSENNQNNSHTSSFINIIFMIC